MAVATTSSSSMPEDTEDIQHITDVNDINYNCNDVIEKVDEPNGVATGDVRHVDVASSKILPPRCWRPTWSSVCTESPTKLSNTEMSNGVECIMGIDEAGRGPVLGSMVYGAAYTPRFALERVEKMVRSQRGMDGFADSKTLNEERRTYYFNEIQKANTYIGWQTHSLSPQDISAAMLKRKKTSLNSISHDAAIGLIERALSRGVNVREVFVDTVGDSSRYRELLERRFSGYNIKFTVCPKADALFAITSAASICAKVTRDLETSRWSFEEENQDKIFGTKHSALFSRDFGSGYPSDPLTKKWLSSAVNPVFGFPSFARFSWSTCTLLLKDSKVASVEWPDEDDETDKAVQKTPKITDMFSKKKPRHHYFRDRNISIFEDF